MRSAPMGHFTAIGMREPVDVPDAVIVDTCAMNDTAQRGTATQWAWANPTNRLLTHHFGDVSAVSVECLWQGTKIFAPLDKPDPLTLAGDWRRGKKKRPIGAYGGSPDAPLITNPGEARLKIYIPAYRRLIEQWLCDTMVAGWVDDARKHGGPVFLRDWDTGRGVHRDGPMSHAWVLAWWLNTGVWPS